jgi:hypothetical protein
MGRWPIDLVSGTEIQIGARNFDDNVTGIFVDSDSSLAASVGSAHGSKVNVDVEVWALAARESTVQASRERPRFGKLSSGLLV